ncbi:MAG: YceI family protein [Bdellovibrionaceae bacterium]|nr:YceI family protein [Pseudobdellovibrionaceae bacterium]MBX3035164.1 YceI family protein [Pseudobdellovibrionaceae bacterium]
MKKYLVFLPLLLLPWCAPASPAGFEEGKNCVSYTVRERFLMFVERTVSGVNCDVLVRFDEVGSSSYRFNMIIPVAGFHSDNGLRDRQVRKILGEERNPNMFLTTEVRGLEEWKHILAQPAYQHTGYLSVAGNAVTMPHFTADNVVAGTRFTTGFAEFKFSDFGLKPPDLLWGLIVKVGDDIRLDFRFYNNQVEGIEKLEGRPLLQSAKR